MRKLIFTIAFACFMPSTALFGDEIELSVGFTDETPIIRIPTKAPVKPMHINLENHQIELSALHPDYTLTLLNEDGEVVWQTVVYAGINTVVLPSSLSGAESTMIDIPLGSTLTISSGTIE